VWLENLVRTPGSTNLSGTNLNARSAARRADYMDVIRNLSRRATQQTRFCGFFYMVWLENLVRTPGSTNLSGTNLNARSAARRADYMDVIRNLSRRAIKKTKGLRNTWAFCFSVVVKTEVASYIFKSREMHIK